MLEIVTLNSVFGFGLAIAAIRSVGGLRTDIAFQSGDQAMKIHAFILVVGGLVGAASFAQAQTAPALPPGPLEHLQDVFGQVVGAGFAEGSDKANPAYREPTAVGLGEAGRAGLLATGSVFAGVVKPFADADAAVNPAPTAAPTVRHRRHARKRINPAAAG